MKISILAPFILVYLKCCLVLSVKMKIAIIGAGPGGLISLKYAIEDGHECDVFEQTGSIGGTWVYTDKTDFDDNGLPIHSAMYQNLLTNLPKEVMSISNFSYPEQNKSYLTQPEVLNYFKNFSDHFNLEQHIKFYKYAIKVQPIENNKWNVTVQDVKTKLEESKIYDAVILCNGRYREPLTPNVPDQNLFQGTQMHSHKYRSPAPFKDKKVLIIGAGPSGTDISVKVAQVAKTVYVSHRKTLNILHRPNNMLEKSEVVKFQSNGAVFADGSEEVFDTVVYCTGYKYSYPFLTDDCNITINDNYVHPLYKHIVNVEHPTMFFMGVPFQIIVIPMLDLQARFIVAALDEKFKLPSETEMIEELAIAAFKRIDLGIPNRHAHWMKDWQSQAEYFQELADVSGIENLPPVLLKIYADVIKSFRNTNYFYKVLDNDNFTKLAVDQFSS